MMLPADSHVHSEWSWDTGGPRSEAAGRMRATCAQAVKIGLPAIIFTEHLDIPRTWKAAPQDLMPHQQHMLTDDGFVDFPVFDAAGYLESIERCRHEFPDLRILTGVEFGQPHLCEAEASKVIDLSNLDRVNGSLHTLQFGPGRAEPHTLFREHPAEKVMWEYLAEIPRMVDRSDTFEVFTHIDYPIRTWPVEELGPFDPAAFEEGFRAAMRAIAASGRALEMNTRRLWSWIPQWWAEEGGQSITFGSDAHEPDAVASHFPEAAAMVEHFGFTPGRSPEAFWTRTNAKAMRSQWQLRANRPYVREGSAQGYNAIIGHNELTRGERPMTQRSQSLVVGLDLDMTLVDTRTATAFALEQVNCKFGSRIDIDDFIRRLGPPIKSELSRWMEPGALDSAVEHFRSSLLSPAGLEKLVPMPGAIELLSWFHQHAHGTVIITSRTQPVATEILARCGLKPTSIYCGVTGTGKAPAMIEGRVTLYAGDHVLDMEGAAAAGVHGVGIATGSHSETELLAAGAADAFPSLPAFLSWFQSGEPQNLLSSIEPYE